MTTFFIALAYSRVVLTRLLVIVVFLLTSVPFNTDDVARKCNIGVYDWTKLLKDKEICEN